MQRLLSCALSGPKWGCRGEDAADVPGFAEWSEEAGCECLCAGVCLLQPTPCLCPPRAAARAGVALSREDLGIQAGGFDDFCCRCCCHNDACHCCA